MSVKDDCRWKSVAFTVVDVEIVINIIDTSGTDPVDISFHLFFSEFAILLCHKTHGGVNVDS